MGQAAAEVLTRFQKQEQPLPCMTNSTAYLHVSEIEVDEAGGDHQVGDATHSRQKHVIGQAEGVRQARALIWFNLNTSPETMR